MNYLQVLGNNVRSLRIINNLTQEQLADICDLHRTYIGAIERGDRNVSLNNIVKIAETLGVTPAILLTDNEEVSK